MPFDVAAAKKEGYSDQEIKDFLNQHFDVVSATAEGYSLGEIGQAVKFDEPEATLPPDPELPVVTELEEPIAPVRAPSPIRFRTEPAVSTGVPIEEPVAPEAPAAQPPILPEIETAVPDITGFISPYIPFEDETERLPEIRAIPGIGNKLIGVAWGLSNNPLNRTIVKLITPPKQGETEEDKNARLDSEFNEIDTEIRSLTPGAVGIGRFAGEAIDIAAAVSAANIIKRLVTKPAVGQKVVKGLRFTKGEKRFIRGGTAGGLFGAAKETTKQLDEADIDMSKILAEGIKEGLMFGLIDTGFGKIVDKIKSRKALAPSEQNIVLNQFRTMTEDEINLLDPDKFIFRGRLDKNALKKHLSDNVSRHGKRPEERIFEQFEKPGARKELATAGELAIERTEPQLRTARELAEGDVFRGRGLPAEERIALKARGDQKLGIAETRKPARAKDVPQEKITTQMEIVMRGRPRITKIGARTPEAVTVGRIAEPNIAQIPEVAFNIKTARFKPELRGTAVELINDDWTALKRIRGPKMKMSKIREMANSRRYDGLQYITQAESEKQIASVVATGQGMGEKIRIVKSLREKGLASPEEIQFIANEANEQIRGFSSWSAHSGRMLRALRVGKQEAGLQGRSLNRLMEELERNARKFNFDLGKALKELETTDLTDPDAMQAFMKKFFPPSKWDMVKKYRYINMLSSYKTQMINAFTNTMQVFSPFAVKHIQAASDFVTANLTGQQRKFFAKEANSYIKTALGGLLTKRPYEIYAKSFSEGAPSKLEFLGITLSRDAGLGKKAFEWPIRNMEATDAFYRSIVQGGEEAALEVSNAMLKRGLTPAQITTEAERKAMYYMFRQGLFPDNQGFALDVVDFLTDSVLKLREKRGVGPMFQFLFPFVQTPSNIFKQGIEFSPLGYLNMVGLKKEARQRILSAAKDLPEKLRANFIEKELWKLQVTNSEQFAKATLGSIVFMGAGGIAASGRTTWKAPKNPKLRRAFYDAGMKPYSLKMGDNWVQYKYLGPFAYPIMIAAAMKHYFEETGQQKEYADKIAFMLPRIMFSTVAFFGDLPYVQGFGDVVETIGGDEAKMQRLLTTPLRQLAPYTAMQGWIDRMTDPFIRDPETFSEFLVSASPFLPPLKAVFGEVPALGQDIEGLGEILPGTGVRFQQPIERKGRIPSSIFPLNVSPSDPTKEERFRKLKQMNIGSIGFKKEVRRQLRETLKR